MRARPDGKIKLWPEFTAKKSYDMVPQSWVINCLKMYKMSHEVINVIEKKPCTPGEWS